ncbi:hypothetical protein J5N97_007064 [Dioscorea zingiberensis]|uniref:Uncharacterized protein n=1 Tax=Dioscorea zingiberensis TaxID=325984 RepID=A0A9D5DB54_9LILI|nr:hypothetical protein J5N97_007064 [Dioscorea zingiberensis]
MPRHNASTDAFIGGACKTGKKGCSSSSSKSSGLQNCRFKREINKMNVGSPSSKVFLFESSPYQPLNIDGIKAQGSVSARKLANAIWEINKIPSPHKIVDIQKKRSKKVIKRQCRMMKSVLPDYLPPHLSDPSHSPVSVISARSRSSSLRKMMEVVPWRSRHNDNNSRVSDFVTHVAEMEIKTCTQGITSGSSIGRTKKCLKDLSIGLTACKELLKTLKRIWELEAQHSSSIPLVSAIRRELDQAHLLVDQLVEEKRLSCDEVTHLKRSFMAEKSAWKGKMQEIIRASLNSIIEEFESERRMRRRSQKLNKKLGLELAKTKTSLTKAIKELDNERRTRELIEQFCNDLVRGIGQDKAEVEEMKRASAKVREELEKEREMLQLADGWREERVQMKLSEAKFQFEEKNAAVDQLRNELETLLHGKGTEESRDAFKDAVGMSEFASSNKDLRVTDFGTDEREGGELQDRLEHDEDDNNDIDSTDSDCHSIELNMDGNNKSYSWSYAANTANDVAKYCLVQRNHQLSSGNLEKTSRRSFSSDGLMSEGWYLNLGSEFHQGRQSRNTSFLRKQSLELNVDMERYISERGLRNHMLTGSRNGIAHCLASPTRQWSKAQDLQDMGDEVGGEGSKVFQMVKAIRESGNNRQTGTSWFSSADNAFQ